MRHVLPRRAHLPKTLGLIVLGLVLLTSVVAGPLAWAHPSRNQSQERLANPPIVPIAARGSARTSIPLSSNPWALAYDSQNGELYVPLGSGNLTVLATRNNSVMATIPLPFGNGKLAREASPLSELYDQNDGLVYVAGSTNSGCQLFPVCFGNPWMMLINGSGNRVVQPPVTGWSTYLSCLAVTPGNGSIYACKLLSRGALLIYNASPSQPRQSIAVGSLPDAATIDTENGEIYVANWGSDNVTVIQLTTGRVLGSIPVGSEPDGILFDSVTGFLYVANNASDNVTVINGASNTVAGSVATGPGPAALAYDASTRTVYVANSCSDSLTAIGDVTNAVVGTVPVGSGPVAIAVDPQSRTLYVANAGSDNVTVAPSERGAFGLTFTESGLPSGTSWSVTLNGTTESSLTSTISFTEPNGTYTYSIADVPGWHQTTSPYSGSITVNGVTVIEPTLMFTQVTYTVTFSESDLPSGLTWTVTVNGLMKQLTTDAGTDSLTWTGLPNETYAYMITDISGWHETTLPYTGSVTVNGAAVTNPTLAYSQVHYTVTFTESGLPSGTRWSVAMAGTTHSSTSGSMSFTEPNGTYLFSVIGVSGYTTVPSVGNITVPGAPTGQSLVFSAVGGGSSSGFLGLPGNNGYYLVGGIAVLVVVGISVALILRLRRK